MNFADAVAAVRTQHRAGPVDHPGGWGWACSCGQVGLPGAAYPTQAQAQARLDRHLQAAVLRLMNGAAQ